MRFQSGFTFLMEFARLDCPHEGCPRTALQTIGDLEQYWRSAICGLTERAGCGARAKVSPDRGRFDAWLATARSFARCQHRLHPRSSGRRRHPLELN